MSVTAVPLRPIKPGSVRRFWVAMAVLLAAGIGTALAQTAGPPDAATFLAANGKKPGVVTTASGLEYQVIKPGTGASPTMSDVALINYDGKLTNGERFDANQHTPMPVGQVVPGFSEALQLMKPGARYRVWIPPQLGYGDKDVPDPQTGKVAIPANSVLAFDIDLLSVMPMAQFQQMMMQQQAAQGGMPPQ